MQAAATWIDGVTDGLIQSTHLRDAHQRKAFYRGLPLADLEAEAEHLAVSFRELDEDVATEKWTADDALIIGRGLDVELEAILEECSWRNAKPGYRAPGQITAEFAQDLKARINGDALAELVVRYHPGTQLKREGPRYRGLCVFHVEKSGSMLIYPNGHFYCWGCGVGGDVYSFFKAYGMSWTESVKVLAGYLGVSLPKIEVSIPIPAMMRTAAHIPIPTL